MNSAGNSIEAFVFERIADAQKALWRAELLRRGLTLVIASLAGMLLWWVVDHWIWSPGVIGRSLLVGGGVAAVVAYLIHRVRPVMSYRVRADYAARCLERDHPELGHSLSSYIGLSEQMSERATSTAKPANAAGLPNRVIQSVGAEAARKLRSIDSVPSEATGLMPWWATTIGLIAALAIYSAVSTKSIMQSTARIFQPLADLHAPQRVQISDIVPGDAETLAGRTLQVSAAVRGLRENELVHFVWANSEGSLASVETFATNSTATSDPDVAKISLSPIAGGELNQFGGEIEIAHHASGTRRYFIEAGDASAGPFELSIRDTPVVRVAEVHYQPPAYTGQKPRVRRAGAISGVAGTRVRIVAEVNRPITRAILELNPRLIGQDVRSTAGASEMEITDGGLRAEYELVLQSRGGNGAIELEDYRIRVWDDADQSNTNPIIHPIEVIEDLPPEVAIVVPQRSPVNVPIDSVQRFEIHASDVDFGLSLVEIEVRRGIDLIARSSIWQADQVTTDDPSANRQRILGNRVIEYRFRPSRMITLGRGGRLNVGDEVEVVAIATDNRTSTDGVTLPPGASPNAGVTRTPPIRLKITMPENPGQTPPPEQDNNKRRQPESKSGGQGQDDQGQQGGSQGGQSSESQSGQGQGQEGGGQQGGNQSGEGQAGEGQESQGGGESQDNNADQSDADPGSEADKSSSADQGSSNEPMKESSSEPGSKNSGETNSGNGNGDPTQGSTNPNDSESGDPQSDGRTQNQDAAQNGQSAGNESDEPGKSNNSGNFSDQSQNGSSQRPPQDDAEAFERIKEYLDQQKKQGTTPQSKNRSGDEGGADNNQSSQGDQSQNADQSKNGKPSNSEDSTASAEQPPSDTISQDGQPQSANQGESPERNPVQNGEGQNPDGRKGNDAQNAEQQNAEQRSGDQQRNERPGDGQEKNGKPGENQDGAKQADSNPGSDSNQNNDSSQPDDSSQQDGSEGAADADSESGSKGDSKPSPGGDANQDDGAEMPNQQNPSKPDSNPQDATRNGQPNDQQGDSGDGSSGEVPQSTGSDSNSSPNNRNPDKQNAAGQSSEPPNSNSDPSRGNDPQADSGNESPSGTGTSSQSNDPKSSDSKQDDSNPSDASSNGGSSGAGSGELLPGEEAELPDPVDMEYTQKATDLVLDYLDETRQAPDPELLDRLRWTEQDLQRFQDRWRNVQRKEQDPGKESNMSDDVRDALRSLGMRPPGDTQQTQRDRADNLRGLRDSGNRREAPASVRDAFEAFRRGLSR